jgi:hypothetical protein
LWHLVVQLVAGTTMTIAASVEAPEVELWQPPVKHLAAKVGLTKPSADLASE